MLRKVNQVSRNQIRVIIIVSILWRIQAVGADLLISLKIRFQRFIYLLQRVLLIIKYQLLE